MIKNSLNDSLIWLRTLANVYKASAYTFLYFNHIRYNILIKCIYRKEVKDMEERIINFTFVKRFKKFPSKIFEEYEEICYNWKKLYCSNNLLLHTYTFQHLLLLPFTGFCFVSVRYSEISCQETVRSIFFFANKESERRSK